MTLIGPAFDERFDELARLAYRVAYRLVGSRPDAEDIAQETLARASVRWRKVGPYAEAWITRVATNLALGQLRRRAPSGPPGRPESADDQTVADRHALVAAMRALPRRQRQAVAMRFLADLSEAQVAEALGCTTGTVKQHTSRGLAALRRHLDADLDPTTDDPPGDLHVRPAR